MIRIITIYLKNVKKRIMIKVRTKKAGQSAFFTRITFERKANEGFTGFSIIHPGA